MVLRVAFLLLVTALPAMAAPQSLVLLSPSGMTRNGLPVLERRAPDDVSRVLARGCSGRLLRLYALEQEYLRRETGAAPEPAYLLLSTQQGGFPRFGFVLDGVAKPEAGYVDLHQRSSLSGRFGAMDQIFPHELLHVMARQMAGEPRESGANQVHAVGVRTDPVIAFQEGFAEHVQILCVDDPDADAATRALREDVGAFARAEAEFGQYGRSVGRRWALGSASELRFLLWFSSAEQVMRYHAVKANRFARQARIPDRLLRRSDKYAAYLHQSVVPGGPDDPLKPAGVLLATEGVIAHLFWRWVTDPVLQQRYRDGDFYGRFGTNAAVVDPLDNAYLKIFHALRAGRAGDTVAFLRSYVREFPDEADRVAQLVEEALGGQGVPDAPELFLANPSLQTGTSLFDQFRALPRTHTFDANAATTLDWLAVPGVSAADAERLVHHSPYRDLAALQAAAGNPGLAAQIVSMGGGMAEVRRAAESETSLSLSAVVRAYLWRLAAYLAAGALAGAWLARHVGPMGWGWAVPCGVAAAAVVFGLTWVVTGPAWLPLAAPVIAGGLPAAAWRAWRRRGWRSVVLAAVAWLAAALPAAALAQPWW
jgi:hypothetical protein